MPSPCTLNSGNVDDDGQSVFPSEAVIELAGFRIAIRHILYKCGKLTKDGRGVLQREQPDIFVFSHTRQPKVEWFGDTLLFNPGSAGSKRFKLLRGVGCITIDNELFQRTYCFNKEGPTAPTSYLIAVITGIQENSWHSQLVNADQWIDE